MKPLTIAPPGVPGPSLQDEPAYKAGLCGSYVFCGNAKSDDYEQRSQYRIWEQGVADRAKKGKK